MGRDDSGPMSSSRSALNIDVATLRRQTGSVCSVRRTVQIDGLEISTARVRDGQVELDLALENVLEGIVVTGRLTAVADGECRRCLKPVSEVLDLNVREIFELHPTEGETWPIVDDHVDLEPMVRESVLLSLPLAPLCGEDCLGPQPDRFPTSGREEGGDRADDTIDPRWAALDELELDE